MVIYLILVLKVCVKQNYYIYWYFKSFIQSNCRLGKRALDFVSFQYTHTVHWDCAYAKICDSFFVLECTSITCFLCRKSEQRMKRNAKTVNLLYLIVHVAWLHLCACRDLGSFRCGKYLRNSKRFLIRRFTVYFLPDGTRIFVSVLVLCKQGHKADYKKTIHILNCQLFAYFYHSS